MDLFSLLLQNVSSPHSELFPRAEILEEAFNADFAVERPLYEPVGQTGVVDRLVPDVLGDAFFREGEVVTLEAGGRILELSCVASH